MRSAARLFFALLLAFGAAQSARGDDPQKPPEHKITQSPSYLEVDPMYATIIDDDKPCGLLMLGIGLDVPDAVLRVQAEHDMPVLRDAYLRNLILFTSTSVRPSEQPDVTVIADRLQRVTDRVLGRKGARLLLAQVAMRISR